MLIQLDCLRPTPIQQSLDIDLPKKQRGNPNFISKWLNKSKAIRIPEKYSSKVLQLCKLWENNPDTQDSIEIENFLDLPKVSYLSVNDLTLDPKRLQYKLAYSEGGKTGSLIGIQKWDHNLAGIFLVWVDPVDGLTYVVNGHNRVNLAKKLEVNHLLCKFIECDTAIEARKLGALANLSEGRGTAIDAAKFLRECDMSKETLSGLLPIREKIVCDGFSLAKLHSLLFDKTIDGSLPLDQAIAIGDCLESWELQIELWKMINSHKGTITVSTIRELSEIVLSAVSGKTSQCTLFGIETFNTSLAILKAEICSYINSQLSKDKRVFSSVSKNKARLEQGNNTIDKDSSESIAHNAKIAQSLFNQLKNQSGLISQLINDACTAIDKGMNSVHIKNGLYNAILEALTQNTLAF